LTTHQEQLIDDKITEVNKRIEALVKLQEQLKALERKGSREQAFFAGRRSMAYELRESGALGAGRLGLEILFLLPDDFVQFYGSLFHRALNVGDASVMHGRSGGVEKAIGNTGTVLGSDTRLQSSGSGKKFKNTPMAIGNEDMLKLKQRLDGKLVTLVREFTEYIGLQGQGTLGGPNGSAGPQSFNLQCPSQTCRRYVKKDWKFCPGCGMILTESGSKGTGGAIGPGIVSTG
jgi:hypothetical protein